MEKDTDMFCLSAAGMMNAVPFEERDFTFIVDGAKYKCCRFQACFLSRRVCQLVFADKTIDTLSLDIDDANREFRHFVSLMNGGSIKITAANADFLERCARELENDEILARLMCTKFDGEEEEIVNIIREFHLKEELHQDTSAEVRFIARRFCEIDRDLLKTLTLNELEEILSSADLRLYSEDQLFESLLWLIQQNGQDYRTLLRYVQVENLCKPNIEHFIDQFFPNLFSPAIWSSLRKCITVSSNDTQNSESDLSRYSPPQKSSWQHPLSCADFQIYRGPFAGIISHLSRKCGGNPHEMGVLQVSCSGSHYN